MSPLLWLWVQVLQGLIWVWAEPGPLAFIESAASAPILDPMRTQAQKWSYGFCNYVRDVPGWVVVVSSGACHIALR